jgi:lysophospholipase L1-like esterase
MKNPVDSRKSPAKTCLFAVTAVFAFLILTDIFLRLFLAPPPSRPFEWPPSDMTRHGLMVDERLFWKLRPGYNEPWRLYKLAYTCELGQNESIDWEARKQAVAPVYRRVTWEVNEAGFRGRMIPAQKPAGTIRLLFLGSSITFGWGVAARDAFPEQVRKALEQGFPGTAFEVINAGVPGYSSCQGLRYLEEILPRYRPDVVVAEFGINDGTLAVGKTDKDQRPTVSEKVLPVLRNSGWSRLILAVFRPAVSGTDIAAKRQTLQQAQKNFYRVGMTGPLTRVAARDFRANLQAMGALCRDYGALFFPAIPALYNEYGQKNVISAVNLLTPETISFQRIVSDASQGPSEGLFLPYDEGHLSVKGHKVVAEGIVDFLKPRVEEYCQQASVFHRPSMPR